MAEMRRRTPLNVDAAAECRRLAEQVESRRLGAEMLTLMRDLFPLFRSVTGAGLRETLRRVSRVAPLQVHEVPSGTAVFDWTVPREWMFRSAKLTGPDGELIADAERCNLELVSYSAPFAGRLSLEELQPHLYSLPDQPDLIPYRTTFYRTYWGFCLPHARRQALRPGLYDVKIDTSFFDGSLSYGELVLPGASTDEVLISTHCCHPSLANDNLSGIALTAQLGALLVGLRLRYTYRFLFAPGTIGAITWLALNREKTPRIRHGLVVAGVGNPGPLHYKRSRRGDATIDRAAVNVLAHADTPHVVRDFIPYGYDERQYCSPGFDLPVGSLTRTPFGEYSQYHTSADDLSFVAPEVLAESLRRYLEILEVLEGDRVLRNTSPFGEPQLGKRGLLGGIGGAGSLSPSQMAINWVLNLCDGHSSLLAVAERSGRSFAEIRAAAAALEKAGLLVPA
jgi:aminopeptidase-like protein